MQFSWILLVIPFVRRKGEHVNDSSSAAFPSENWTVIEQSHSLLSLSYALEHGTAEDSLTSP